MLGFSFCVPENLFPVWAEALGAVQITLGICMCLLTVIRFVKESLQMYKVTKQIRFNRYMKLLVGEGTTYFIVYVSLFFDLSIAPLG